MGERGSVIVVLLVFTALAFNLSCPGNRPPVIESLTADPPAVEPYDTTKVTCEAYDPDGDELTYTWNWSNGVADTVGTDTVNYISWVAPGDTGRYEIGVRVSDGIATVGPRKITVEVKDLLPLSVELYEPEELADWNGGLQVIDVSDPRNPQIVSFCEIPDGFISDVYAGGAHAYLTD